MKRKWIAAGVIFLLFLGFAWHLESNDNNQRVNKLVHTQDTNIDIEQVDFGSIEEVSEEYGREIRVHKPFQSREYIRIVPSANIPQTN
jgi:hypothetical protein